MLNQQIPDFPKEKFKLIEMDTSLNERIEKESLTFWQDARVRLFKNPGAVTGMVILLFLTFMSIVAPFFNPYSYKDQLRSPETNQILSKLPPRVPGLENMGIFDGSIKKEIGERGLSRYKEDEYKILSERMETIGDTQVKKYMIKEYSYVKSGAKDIYFWFGTDELGRDQWTRTWQGTRVSLLMGVISALVCMIVGIAYGSVAGYYGGRIDNIMMRFCEVISGIPYLVVVIIFILLLEPGLLSILLALTVTSWIGMARVVRSQILKLKNQEFVLAAKTLGTSDFKIILKHMYPNIIGQIMIMITFIVPSAIFYEAFLAFIGFGLPAPAASLGVLISDGQKILITYPHIMTMPAIVISILMLSLNIFANGLRDALDPRMKNN